MFSLKIVLIVFIDFSWNVIVHHILGKEASLKIYCIFNKIDSITLL